MQTNDIAFMLILHGGNARSKVMEALKYSRNNYFQKASEKLNEADDELEEAHKIQSDILKKEANGEDVDLSILFVHAQDHLMTAMLARDLSQEIIDLRKTNNKQQN